MQCILIYMKLSLIGPLLQNRLASTVRGMFIPLSVVRIVQFQTSPLAWYILWQGTPSVCFCTKDIGFTRDTDIIICLDSQSAIRSLHKPKIMSELIRESTESLNELAVELGMRTCWNTGQWTSRSSSTYSKYGNVHRTRIIIASLTYCEKTAMRDWGYKQNEKRFEQTKEMIMGGWQRRERALPRQSLRLVSCHRQLDLSCTSAVTLFNYCNEAIKNALWSGAECPALQWKWKQLTEIFWCTCHPVKHAVDNNLQWNLADCVLLW